MHTAQRILSSATFAIRTNCQFQCRPPRWYIGSKRRRYVRTYISSCNLLAYLWYASNDNPAQRSARVSKCECHACEGSKRREQQREVHPNHIHSWQSTIKGDSNMFLLEQRMINGSDNAAVWCSRHPKLPLGGHRLLHSAFVWVYEGKLRVESLVGTEWNDGKM